MGTLPRFCSEVRVQKKKKELPIQYVSYTFKLIEQTTPKTDIICPSPGQ